MKKILYIVFVNLESTICCGFLKVFLKLSAMNSGVQRKTRFIYCS